ncbi:MAG: hypothetical protein QOF63_2632 [Thermoanaerobaculia bacterium]|jgi:hypothetical protein|nr:hypothetical protein [Thermoanaerobaculia bacterium]
MLRLAAALFAAAAISTPQPQVLFAITDDSGAETALAIEPVAMVTKTPGSCAGCWTVTFANPPLEERKQKEAKEFAARYYRPGRTYRVLATGVEIATAKVESETSLGCVSLAARVTVTPPRRRGDWNRKTLLAIGSMHVVPRKPFDRELTLAEDKAIWSVGERELRARGVAASLFRDMDGHNFLATDLNGDGRRDLVGSFQARNPKTHDTHHLFVIALADDTAGYRSEYVWYYRESKIENSIQRMQLVDSLDLDEDGTDEVVVSNDFYESHVYRILKRGRDGKWTIVYSGGGSGC